MLQDWFGVIAGPNGCNGIRMVQIMEPGFIQTDLFADLFIVYINCMRLQVIAQFVGKDKTGVLVALSILETVDELPMLHFFIV